MISYTFIFQLSNVTYQIGSFLFWQEISSYILVRNISFIIEYMDQLSNNFQEKYSQAPSSDFTLLHNLSLEFSPSQSHTSIDGSMNACEIEHEGSSLHQSELNIYSNHQQHAAQDDLVVMPLDVPSFLNQNFLISLNMDSPKLFLAPKRRELSLHICRSGKSCVICQQQIKRKSIVYALKCRHHFHQRCLKKWHQKHNTCPLCRRQLQ